MTLSPYKVKHRCSDNIVTMTVKYEPQKIVTERHGKQNRNNVLGQFIKYQKKNEQNWNLACMTKLQKICIS